MSRCLGPLGAVVESIPTKSWWCRHSVCIPYTVGGLMLWALCNRPAYPGRRAHLRCRPGVLNKTSCHMWGSWCLSMFLLRVGSVTFMSMTSLMVLVMVCDHLPTMENSPVWYDDLRCWHGHRWGKVSWDAPLTSLQRSFQTPLCTPHHTPAYLSHLYLYITLLFWVMLSLFLGAIRRFWSHCLPWDRPVYLPFYKYSWHFCWNTWDNEPPCGCCCWW